MAAKLYVFYGLILLATTRVNTMNYEPYWERLPKELREYIISFTNDPHTFCFLRTTNRESRFLLEKHVTSEKFWEWYCLKGIHRKNGEGPVSRAIRREYFYALGRCIQAKKYIGNVTGMLCWGIQKGSASLIKILLNETDVDINKEYLMESTKHTPLVWAITFGQQKVIDLFLAFAGLDVNKDDPLSWAILLSRKKTLQLLLAHPNIQVNKRDVLGYLPIHWATRDGSMEVLELLLAHPDIDVNAKTALHITPLQLARENNRKNMLTMLKKAGAKE